MGWERPRCLFYFRWWRRSSVSSSTRFRFGGSGSPSRRGWLRVFCGTRISDGVLCTKLLRWIWQRWSNDDSGWHTYVLIPDFEARKCGTTARRVRWWRSTGYSRTYGGKVNSEWMTQLKCVCIHPKNRDATIKGGGLLIVITVLRHTDSAHNPVG